MTDKLITNYNWEDNILTIFKDNGEIRYKVKLINNNVFYGTDSMNSEYWFSARNAFPAWSAEVKDIFAKERLKRKLGN